MTTSPDITRRNGRRRSMRRARVRQPMAASSRRTHVTRTPRRSIQLATWLQGQAINVSRHAEALRPFRRDEFGTTSAAPTEAHIQATNDLIGTLRSDLLRMIEKVRNASTIAMTEQTAPRIQHLLRLKERAHEWVQAIERVWDFYFELFGQRQSRFGDWLLGCDRIVLDCYQVSYTGLAVARSVPAPPPFSYMRTGFSPATYRRGIPLRRLGQQINPFPLIQLPYHRLINPWTLGAVLHEVSHNLQNDLGLEHAVPRSIAQALLQAGFGRHVAATWTRWNRELFADVSGLLLGGPAIVGSLIDVIGRGPTMVMGYAPGAPHPTPYLRTLISTELLRRMGFPDEANAYQRAWMRMYPNPQNGNIPPALIKSWPEVIPLVVDTVCFQPYPSLGNRSLAQTIRFAPKDQRMFEEAACRIATKTDPGVVPARFLIGAARVAFEQHLAQPEHIAQQFYKELARR